MNRRSVSITVGRLRKLALERWSVEVRSMLRHHLETHEVGVLVPDQIAVNKDVVLFHHQLAEAVQV